MTLKELREQMGMTQKDLAFHSKVSEKTIREIEKHKRAVGNISVNTAARLALALGVRIEDLTGKIIELNDKIYFENDFEWIRNAGE